LCLLEEKFDALGQFARDLGLVRHHAGKIELDACPDAELGEMVLRFVEQLARIQKGLGRDAASVEAGAAKGAAAVDARRLEAELPQPDGGIVAARSAADDHRIETVRHESQP